MRILINIISSINKSMIWIGGIIVFIMSTLLTVDVILRYFFNSPTSWAFDMSTWGTTVLAFSLGGYVLLIGEHVRVDFLFEKLTKRQKSIVDLISALFLFLMAGSFIWIGMGYVIHYYNIGAMSTGGWNVPLWIKWAIVPIGGLLIGLQGLVKLFNDLYIIVTGKSYIDQEEA